MVARLAFLLYRLGQAGKDHHMRWDGTELPLLEPGDDFAECAAVLADSYDDEFTLYPGIEAQAIEAAALAGFMPMAARLQTPQGPWAVLVPKLHRDRCLFDPSLTHVTRTARRESQRYRIGVNGAFNDVVQGCVRCHGEDWLVPELVDAFRELHETRAQRRVAFLSVELWSGSEQASRLVAGEIGYLIGSSYASLSGFSVESGAGTVQLMALGALLGASGVQVWDLGMPMDYKRALGGVALPRDRYLPALRRAYAAGDGLARAALLPRSDTIPARSIIDAR